MGQLDREGIAGGSHAIRIKLEHLKELLINELIDKVISESESISRVEREFVGEKVRPSGGGKGLYASPGAIAMLDLKATPIRASKTWRSANQLIQNGESRGSRSDLAAKLKNLRDDLVRDVVGAGISQEDAVALVDRNLIGRRRTGLGSQEALYASPDALRILGERGDLPRADPLPRRGR